MLSKIKCLYTLLFSLITAVLFAQENNATPPPQQIGNQGDVQLLYRNEMTFAGIVHGNGFGFNFRRGKHVTGFRKRNLEIEFVNIKHPKEFKTTNPVFDRARSYFYGKLNVFNVLRIGYGYQQQLYGKQDRKGVEIRMVYFIGPSLGLVKPVYLQILVPTTTPQEYHIITEKYDPAKHFIDNIYGRAPYFKGFNEVKPIVGGYAKFGIAFEYANYDDAVKAIETGIALDVYPKVIPIMANTKNQQVFPNLYIKFIWGRKWF